MTKYDLKSAFDAVMDLPESNQAEIAEFLASYVEEQRAPSLLSGEQQAEVARRLADPHRKRIPHDEVMASVRRLLG